MAARVRAFDWAATPLGDPATWPAELVTSASFVLESHMPAALVWGPDYITIYNDAFRPILGNKPEALGRSFRDIWAEAWDELLPIVTRAYAGESTFIEDFPLIIDRRGFSEQAWFTFSYSPVRRADGTVMGMIDTVIETTSAVQARERNRMINNELGHRLKNTMALVQAISGQSFRHLADRTPVEAFNARIVALGAANDVLLQARWESAAITDVIASALAAHDAGDRVRTNGPGWLLGPKAVLSLAMLLHELGTNAQKYGALSADGGFVELDWTQEGDDFVLRWRELGGPPAAAPARTGFGTRLINLGLLGTGRSIVRYLSTGLDAEFRVAVQRLAES